MSEDKKPFAVKDRRHFTVEGEAREADSPAEKPPPAVPEEVPEEPPPPRANTPTLDFTSLLLSLGAQASLLLTGDPASGGPPALAEARAIISLLEVLEQKTEGRRTADEDDILHGLLYELRMTYVAASRMGGT
jgi:hypothetical protein